MRCHLGETLLNGGRQQGAHAINVAADAIKLRMQLTKHGQQQRLIFRRQGCLDCGSLVARATVRVIEGGVFLDVFTITIPHVDDYTLRLLNAADSGIVCGIRVERKPCHGIALGGQPHHERKRQRFFDFAAQHGGENSHFAIRIAINEHGHKLIVNLTNSLWITQNGVEDLDSRHLLGGCHVNE